MLLTGKSLSPNSNIGSVIEKINYYTNILHLTVKVLLLNIIRQDIMIDIFTNTGHRKDTHPIV